MHMKVMIYNNIILKLWRAPTVYLKQETEGNTETFKTYYKW